MEAEAEAEAVEAALKSTASTSLVKNYVFQKFSYSPFDSLPYLEAFDFPPCPPPLHASRLDTV